MPEKERPLPEVEEALSLDSDPESIKAYYAKWAESYDQDLEGYYTAPRMIVGVLVEYLESKGSVLSSKRGDLVVADAGCGTGLVGQVLREAGFRHIDGMDISSDMVEKARELDVYRSLYGDVDITQPLRSEWISAYDTVLCCGVFTLGHVPPTALRRLIEMARAPGVVITSTRTAYYDATDYQKVSDEVVSTCGVDLVKQLRDAPYTADGDAHYWVYEIKNN